MITKLVAAAALVVAAQLSLVTQASAAVTTSPSATVNGTIGFSTGSYAVYQSSGSVVVTALRTGGTAGALSVTYTTANGTALASVDYTTATGTLNWADGDGSSKNITIPISKATVFTGTKYFVVRVTAGTNTLLGSHTSASINITGGSGTASATLNGTIGLSTGAYTVNQSAGSVVLTAVRTGATAGALTVTYATSNGSALAGTNYTASTGTLNWADGDGSAKTFTIAVNKTNVFSGTKYFVVKLTAGVNTILGSHSNASVTITGGTGTTTPPPPAVKSIKQWGVSCSETIDESAQLASALAAAAGGAFTLQIDCPVRFHTGTAYNQTITVQDGTTIEFVGAGELLTVGGGATALAVAHPSKVTFTNWNLSYL